MSSISVYSIEMYYDILHHQNISSCWSIVVEHKTKEYIALQSIYIYIYIYNNCMIHKSSCCYHIDKYIFLIRTFDSLDKFVL
jgi:hypothetical protein